MGTKELLKDIERALEAMAEYHRLNPSGSQDQEEVFDADALYRSGLLNLYESGLLKKIRIGTPVPPVVSIDNTRRLSYIISLEKRLEALENRERDRQAEDGELYNFLTELGYAISASGISIQRILPFRVYFEAEPEEESLLNAVVTICDSVGFELVKAFAPIYGSFLQQLFIRSKEALDNDEVQKRLEKLERAAELKLIDEKQANVDKTKAEAVRNLLEAAKTTPNAVFQIGSVLIMKLTDESTEKVVSFTLNFEQVKILNENPSLLLTPQLLLKQIGIEEGDEARD